MRDWPVRDASDNVDGSVLMVVVEAQAGAEGYVRCVIGRRLYFVSCPALPLALLLGAACNLYVGLLILCKGKKDLLILTSARFSGGVL